MGFERLALHVIMIIQLVAPLTLLWWALWRINFGNERGRVFGFHEFMYFRTGSMEHGLSHLGLRVMGLLFLMLNTMNGLHVLDNHRRQNVKITNFVLFMRRLRSVP